MDQKTRVRKIKHEGRKMAEGWYEGSEVKICNG